MYIQGQILGEKLKTIQDLHYNIIWSKREEEYLNRRYNDELLCFTPKYSAKFG